jgi:rod shape-determining protein MreD
MLLQVLLLNNIQFSGYINPFLYVMFILMLPIETPTWLVISLGFVCGISMDAFSDTAGLHAAATTAMAYVRSYILKLFAPRDGYEFGMKPTLYSLGTTWFAYYSGILVVSHHLVLFTLETFRFNEIGFIIAKTLISSFFTIAVIFVAQLLIFKNER